VISLWDTPLSQLECQKLDLSPFPTKTIVDALKRSLSVLSQGRSSPTQGLSVNFYLNQSVDGLYPY
jgi:hypothetical protein